MTLYEITSLAIDLAILILAALVKSPNTTNIIAIVVLVADAHTAIAEIQYPGEYIITGRALTTRPVIDCSKLASACF